ncbi:MAG: efflux RND transporter periplasmic adaptor subunit [Eubacteriales bacterium]|jgi:HlyD family secretion protein
MSQDMLNGQEQNQEIFEEITEAVENTATPGESETTLEPLTPEPEVPGKKKKKVKKERKKMSKKAKRILTATISLLVVGSIALGMYKLVFEEKPPEIQVGVVSRGPMISEIRNTGVAVPKESKDITTAALGKVLEVYVKEGDQVKAGDRLFSIDSATLMEELNKKRDEMNDRLQDVNKIQESINNLQVKAPFSGKIMDVTAKKGDTASGKIGTMVDDSYMKLTLYYSYAYVDQIKVGQSATVSIPQSMASVNGTVDNIERIEKITPQGTVLFEVTIKMKNPGTLTKGMAATASIKTSSGEVMPAENGTLEYNQEMDVQAKSSGEIVEMRAKDYYKFNAGEVLCVVQDDSLHTSLISAKESYDGIRKEYEKLQEKQQDYEAVAPIDGTVMLCTLEAGQELTGESGTVMQIADLSEMVVNIQIDELDVGKVQIGMPATVTPAGEGDMFMGGGGVAMGMDGVVMIEEGVAAEPMSPEMSEVPMEGGEMGEEPMTCEVSYISMQGKAENGVSFFEGKITIRNAKNILPNTNVTYSIVTSEKQDCLLMPVAGAVNTDVGQVAFVREGTVPKDQTVELPENQQHKGFVAVPIQVGESDGINVEILSGLEEGMEVAMLLTNTKSGTMYAKSGVFPATEEDRVILSDSSSDFSLMSNQIRISPLQETDGSAPIYTTDRTVPRNLMGRQGLLLLEGGGDGVRGFLPYRSTLRTYLISKTTASAITTSEGTKLSISNSLPVIMDGKIRKYGDCFFDLLPGNSITVCYGANGAMESLSLSSGVANVGPYVLHSDGGLSEYFSYAGGTIYKNGVKIEQKELKKYDVVSYDPASNTYYASDIKVTGMLEDAKPALQNPSQVTVLGQTYDVLETARSGFESLKLGQGVTLLLTSNNKVAGVVPSDEHRAVQYALLNSVEGKTVDLTILPSGQSLKGEADTTYTQLVGEIVQVNVGSSGKMGLSRANFSSTSADLYLQERKLGDDNLAANVRVFEKSGYFSTPVAIDIEQLDYIDVIPRSSISGILRDSSGTPVVVLLKDATGAAYRYGKISAQEIVSESGESKTTTISVTTLDSEGKETTVSGEAMGGMSTPFMYGGVMFNGKGQAVAGMTLEKAGTVGLDKFQRDESVQVGGRWVSIMDNVPVYMEATGHIVPLERAKALCTEFTIYVNPKSAYGQVVRMIVAK